MLIEVNNNTLERREGKNDERNKLNYLNLQSTKSLQLMIGNKSESILTSN